MLKQIYRQLEDENNKFIKLLRHLRKGKGLDEENFTFFKTLLGEENNNDEYTHLYARNKDREEKNEQIATEIINKNEELNFTKHRPDISHMENAGDLSNVRILSSTNLVELYCTPHNRKG